MALSVGDFTSKVANGGSLRLKSQEGRQSRVTNFATNFKGRVTAFFRGLFKPGTVATENKNVLNAFVTSLRGDPAYGDRFADMAATTLARNIERGKPLTTRNVQQVMDQIQEAKRQNIGFTHFQAMVVSENQDNRPGTFGSMFADIAHEKGLPVLTSAYDTHALSQSIMSEVRMAGQSGMGTVTAGQAQSIAKNRINIFLENVKSNIDTIQQNMTAGPERTAMKKAVLTFTAVIKPKTITSARQVSGTATSLINDMCDSRKSVNERLGSVKAFLDDVLGALEKNYEEVGSDDLNAVLTLALSYAGKMSSKTETEISGAFDACKGFKDTAMGLSVPLTGQFVRNQSDMDDVRKAGNGLTVLSRIGEFFAGQAGYGSEMGTAILMEQGEGLTRPDQINPAGRSGMGVLGVPIPGE
ncbi:MAG: hypothetical protein HUK40_08725 [Desulfobacter sp.]|nr:hypothetical protein [Desulfobacter sp.]